MIRKATGRDAAAICDIYNYYVENTVITFEEELVSPEDMQNRIETIGKTLPWIAWEEDGVIQGYAYASPWNVRSAYRHSVESTVYLDPKSIGKGLGRALYEALISQLKDLAIHSIIGGIALPNEASVALHEKLGYQKAAHYKEVGWKMNRWIDVGYWQLIVGE